MLGCNQWWLNYWDVDLTFWCIWNGIWKQIETVTVRDPKVEKVEYLMKCFFVVAVNATTCGCVLIPAQLNGVGDGYEKFLNRLNYVLLDSPKQGPSCSFQCWSRSWNRCQSALQIHHWRQCFNFTTLHPWPNFPREHTHPNPTLQLVVDFVNKLCGWDPAPILLSVPYWVLKMHAHVNDV